MGTLIIDKTAEQLLDFSKPQIDINILDSVVNTMHAGSGPQQRTAQTILTQLKEHPDAWQRVDAILQFSQNPQTKYYGLQILEDLIKRRWKITPREQCQGIRNFVVDQIIKISSDQELMNREKTLLNKMNMVLVQIVKKEWPRNWPNFVSEIVGASKTSESLCQNNMNIMKLLSEEVFDFSAGQMTQTRAEHLKKEFCGQFSEVFELCRFVMENSQNAPLIAATLETCLKFLNWIPLGYVFETDLIPTLVNRFLNVPIFRNVTLKCLTEIAGVAIPPNSRDQYGPKVIDMFLKTMSQLSQVLPPETDIRAAYSSGSDSNQKFVANLAMFLTTILKEHGNVKPEGIEQMLERNADLRQAHRLALDYLLSISAVEDVEIFKICLDYWNWLSAEMYRECPFIVGGYTTTGYGLTPYASPFVMPDMPTRRRMYNEVLTKLRYIIIGRMAKPEEVLVVENDQGEIVRETIKDTDAINLYKTMRETLVYLTHLDYQDTERIMTEKLQNQVNGLEWSWKNLNTLCWAIGSISGAMMEEDEKRFLVTVIRDLLGLCEQKRGKDNKAVIASNIMYVVGQYPRFLRAHWKFLKTVVNKLFEFMHETHEGVQDMACDTFIKIAHKCRRHFVIVQVGEVLPFIDEILNNLNSIICDLTPAQVQVFYEAIGFLISAQHEQPVQANLIERLMAMPNNVWDDIIQAASRDVTCLRDPDVVKNVANILKTNHAACKSVGHPFINQLSKIYLDMLNVYKVMSENVSEAVQLNGEQVLTNSLLKSMRGVKTETLRLISTWVSKAEDSTVVQENFVPPLFEAVLFDYQRNVPLAREPEVLTTMATIINRLEINITPLIPNIFDAVFMCTLEMINKDFQEFPEHRTEFFNLLQAVNEHCFEALLSIPPEQFRLVLNSIIWALRHSMRNVTESGLDILYKLLVNVASKCEDSIAQSFFQTYYIMILENILSEVTDASQAQVAGLTYFSTILTYLFYLVEQSGRITAPLNAANPQQSNVDFVYQHVFKLLKENFKHLNEDQIRVIVKGFFSYDNDVPKFKEHLRDFLVQIKEFEGEDTADLFLEEREREIQGVQERKEKIPGLINPHEMSEEMQD